MFNTHSTPMLYANILVLGYDEHPTWSATVSSQPTANPASTPSRSGDL